MRIITNSLTSTDVGLVHAGYAKHRRAKKASLHAKSFVLDRNFIGSLNLDPRSVTENTEI